MRKKCGIVILMEIIAADGSTGEVKYSRPTPLTPPGDHGEHNIFPRILGDSLFFCDLRGLGHDRDIIFKDRYNLIWAMNDKFDVMWTGKCTTGHYPFAYDIDNDGRNEVAVGYSMFDDDNPKPGRLYKPQRNGLYNYSNYQATVSLPGWDR